MIMSEQNRTPEEYIELFARDNCNGDKEAAAEQAIVKEVIKSLEKN